MNVCAAVFAALSRVGETSVADMLPETSTARMTVPLACDTGTVTDGPAPAIPSAAMPATISQMPRFIPRPPRPARRAPLAATPAEASAAARRRATATVAQARAMAVSRPTASSAG